MANAARRTWSYIVEKHVIGHSEQYSIFRHQKKPEVDLKRNSGL